MTGKKPSKAAAAGPVRSGQLPKDWSTHPFLQGLSNEHLAMLQGCAMVTQFKPGEEIFREGEIANRFYLVLDGRVLVELTAPDGAVQEVEHVGRGGVLGWSWLFPPYGLHFTAVARELTRAIFFYGTWLRAQCDEDPAFGYELAKRVAGVALHRLEMLATRLRSEHTIGSPDHPPFG